MPPTVPLDDATSAHGGKAAALGRLRRAGLPVPDGFVVPAGAPADDLARAVATGLGPIGCAAVAVRSSAEDEDALGTSAAGQYVSVLGVIGVQDVVAAVLACRASAHGPRVAAYRAATAGDEQPPSGAPEVAVVVQRLVDARAAGVLFTGGTRTVIEASWGLGESVVQGVVDPDRFVVTGGVVTGHRTGAKRTRVDRSSGATVTASVPLPDRARACLDDGTALRLAALGEQVAALLGGPQDVEWAVDDAGALWLLQARPVTAPLPAPRCGYELGGNPGPNSDRSRTHSAGAVLHGTAGSGGRASGPVRVVLGPDDFGSVRPGDVLVCRETDPAWTPLFGVVAAVVTETGGLLSHAAIVARELRLPAVLGVPDATAGLRGAGTVAVDGHAGTVTPAPR